MLAFDGCPLYIRRASMRCSSLNIARSLRRTALSVAFVVAVLASFVSVSAGAPSAGSLAADLAADQRRVDSLLDQQRGVEARILDSEHKYSEQLDDCRERLVALYIMGGRPTFTSVIGKSLSINEASDRASVVEALAKSDERLIRKLQRTARHVRALKRETVSLKTAIKAAKKQISRDRKAVEQARIAAAKARAEVERLALLQEVPLAPRATSPAAVKSAVADEADEQAGDNVENSGTAGDTPGFSQTGTASVYATSFAGSPTASGELYNPGAMTAAHPSLPLGTWVQVAGPGGSALVRINDRGPFVGGRIIDLSSAAAAAVGINGLGRVTISVKS